MTQPFAMLLVGLLATSVSQAVVAQSPPVGAESNETTSEPKPNPPATPASEPDADAPITAEAIEELIHRLASPAWRQRKEATERLIELGPAVYDRLIEAYRSADSFEMRLRIREVVSEIFVASRFPAETGFLGVQQRSITHPTAGPQGQPASAILVVGVLRGSAAERAGVQAGDLIVRFNDQAIPADPTGAAFSKMVGSFKPAETVHLEIRRGNQQGRVAATLGSRPMQHQHDVRPMAREAFAAWWEEFFENPQRKTTTSRPAGVDP